MKKYYDNTIVKDIELNITNKNYAKALLIANQYVEQYPEDKLGPVYLARALGLNGHIDEAREMFNDALISRLHDKSAYLIAYTWYGLMLLSVGNREEGISALLCAISHEDSSKNGLAVKARLTLANFYVDSGKYDEALDIIDINSLDKDLVNSKKAYIYLMKGDYRTCIEYGNKIRTYATDKTMQMNQLNLGRAYAKLHEYDKAKECLSAALTVKNRYYYTAISTLGNVAYLQHHFELALNYASQLLASPDHIDDANRLFFKTYTKLGKFKEAKEALDGIRNYLDHQYYSSYYYILTGEFDKSLELLPSAISHSSGKRTIELLRSFLSIYIRQGKYDEAEYFLNCVEKDLPTPYVEIVRAFIDKSRGITRDDASVYTARQVYNYDEEETIRHILSHHLLGDSSKFFDKESIREVLNEMKERIKTMEGIPDNMSERYLVHYDQIGFDESGILNTLEVIANLGTNDIITFYPLSGADIYEDEEIVKPKELKRMSQIDKFNKRYGNQ